MKNLIEALNIFLKYGNPSYPTHCEHDELWICGYDGITFSEEDVGKLSTLGFNNYDGDGWKSFRYGSA
jgi:hypothetical protein